MWCHSDSLDVQRKLALEAIDVLSKRIKAEYRDDVILKSEISEDTYEVMFALWIEEVGHG